MIRSIYNPKDSALQFDLELSEIARLLEKPAGLLWVSLEQPTAAEIQTVLAGLFHFHPLAIEDCQSPNYQPPKVDDFDDYLFIVVHGLRPDCAPDQLDRDFDTIELNCFLSQHYLVTCYQAPQLLPVQAIWEQMQRNSRLLEHGPDFLCHAILDHLVDEYLPLLDAIDEEIDRLEDEIFVRPRRVILQRILMLKHSMLILRRIIGPQREVMNRLSRDDLPQIARQNRIYYRDIYDHLVRLHDLSEATRDVIGGALDAYLSVTSNRLNEVMKTLAVISTIFLPLSFLAGVYGMNFDYMPILHSPYGYPTVWGVFVMIALGMLWFFKRRGWF